MKKIKLFAIFIAFSVFFVGCGKKEKQAPIRYDISSGVTNLDPQFCDSDSEKLILLNCYEGLFRQKNDGSIENLVCEEYQISSDKKTYTFKLKNNLKWSNDEKHDFEDVPVTADDFVFAFQRIFNNDYPSPYAGKFFKIKNAQQVMNGSLSKEKLGVYAKDDETLVIELSEPDVMLLENLCHHSALPVNRKYFEQAKGQFGMSIKNFVTNGAFIVKVWDNEQFILLRENKNYYRTKNVKISGINFHINRQEDKFELLKKDKADAFASTLEEIEKQQKVGFRTEGTDNAVWAFVFNKNDDVFGNAHITNSLSLDFNRESFADLLGIQRILTSNIVPPMARVMGERYTGNQVINRYNKNLAKEEMTKGLEELGIDKIKGKKLLIPENSDLYAICQEIFQIWQRDLSFFIELEVCENDQYEQKLKDKDFDMAVIKVCSQTQSPYSVLSQFTKDNENNIIEYDNSEYENLLEVARQGQDKKSIIDNYKKAEDMLLKSGSVIPLFAMADYYVIRDNVKNVEFYSYGNLAYFVDAYRATKK